MNVYFEPALLEQVEQLAARKRWSKSSVVEAAVASFFSADAAERQEAATSRRLDRLSRQLERLERDQQIATEALALFVRQWLIVTPALPAESQRAARASGRDRYQGFMDALVRQVARGSGLSEEVARELDAAGKPTFEDDAVDG